MPTAETASLAGLYLEDETAWLDRMAELVRSRRPEEIDWANLGEYLSGMARRGRREVESRLTVLLAHILKWQYQPERRSNCWRGTIVAQRQELSREVAGGVLRRHALEVRAEVYREAVARAAAEAGLPEESFPAECPYSLDEVLSFEAASEA